MNAPAEPGGRAHERSLRSYLLVPRPGDLGKAWLFPLSFCIGAVATSLPSPDRLALALLVWFCLEGLIYPARYQWNDIRGYESDQRHPDAASRGRLPAREPGGPDPVAASAWTAVARLALVGVIAVVAAPALPGWGLPALVIAVFAIALVYESLKSHAAGRPGGELPAPSPAIAGVWLAVGGGYAIRALSGFTLAVPLAGRPSLAVALVCLAWLLGISFVTSRWALEALPFASLREGRLAWDTGSAHGRDHTLALARWLPAPPAMAELASWRPYSEGTSPLSPWNLSFWGACAVAGGAGLILSGQVSPAEVAIGVAFGALTGRVALGGHLLLSALAGAATLAYAASALGATRPWVAALPLLVAFGVRLRFERSSLSGISGGSGDTVQGALTQTSQPFRRTSERHA